LRSSTRALVEVTLLFLLVIGICRLLFQARSVPFISTSLPLWAAGLFLYLPLLLVILQKKNPAEYGLTLKNLGFSVKTALFFSLICLPGFLLLYHLYQHYGLHVPGHISFSTQWALLLLYHLVCVAFPEEVFYRGYIQSRLNEAFPARVTVLGARLGVGCLYTTILFALGHYLIDFRLDTLATFFPGLVFGWLRERTGSVASSTLFHALCNGTVLLVS
jgi:uncharacterized protein